MKSFLILMLGFGLSVSANIFAAENSDHTQHKSHSVSQSSYADRKAKGNLEMLAEVPKSGKSREAGFDNRYAMEPTSAQDNLADQCVKGSRGLIILDRQTLEKCGSTPKGLPERHDSKTSESHTAH